MSNLNRQEWQKALGDEHGSIVCELVNSWVWGRVKFDEFQRLFSKAEDLKFLNAITGGTFLWHIQRILWDDLMLHVTRLTDSLATGPNQNLTIRRIPGFCEDPELQAEVQGRVNDAIEAARLVREWRNKRISHTDLSQLLGPDAEPLNRPCLQQMEKALDSIYAVLQHLSMRLLKKDIANRVIRPPVAGAFIAYTKQLAKAVQYIDSAMDPSGNASITDTEVASNFLGKIGRRPNMKQMRNIFDLREAAGRFK